MRPGWVELKRRDDEACDNVIKIGDALGAERRAHARTKRRLVALRRRVLGFERAWRSLAGKYATTPVFAVDVARLRDCADVLASSLRASDGRRR